jgi:hypothetical protein
MVSMNNNTTPIIVDFNDIDKDGNVRVPSRLTAGVPDDAPLALIDPVEDKTLPGRIDRREEESTFLRIVGK